MKNQSERGEQMQEDVRYRDQLRKDLIDYELIADFLKNGETEKALVLVNKHIGRIRSSLQG